MSLLFALVWWFNIYSPLRDKRYELAEDISFASHERDRLVQKLERLSDKKQNKQKILESHARLSSLVLQGSSMEQISAQVHAWLQEFLENHHHLSLKTYKELPPSKWRSYPISRLEFNMNATTQGLSDLLENLERIEKALRIEKLGVSYRRSKEHDLRISLQLGVLFVEGLKK